MTTGCSCTSESTFYWSATTSASFPTAAWGVGFFNGMALSEPKDADKLVGNVRAVRRPTPAPIACTGDCNGDGQVTVDELLTLVNIALGNGGSCTAGDVNHDGQITIDEILVAVTNALNGCPAPGFLGFITLIVPTNPNEIALAWLPASDDTTPPEQMRYDIYLSLQPDLQPSASSLFTSIVGQTQTLLSGLQPGTTYYLLLVAVDKQGHESLDGQVESTTTPPAPVAFNATTPLAVADSLMLGQPTSVTDTALTFADTGQESLPAIGSVLIGSTGSGGLYLRQVQGVNQSAGSVTINTQPGSLADAVDSIAIRSKVTLFDVAAAASGTQTALPALGATARGFTTRHEADSSGNLYSRVEWKNHLLMAEQRDFATATKRTLVVPGSAVRQRTIRVNASDKVTADLTLAFTPELEAETIWNLFGIQSGRIIARGTLSLDANARYAFMASATADSGEVSLFTRDFTSLYVIGTVPVYQRVTLTVTGQVTATASTQITASADAQASSVVEIGVVYDPGSNTWQPISSVDFNSSLTTSLDVKGGVTAQVHLIPKITVAFYEALSGTLEIDPSVEGNIQAQGTLIAPCAPLQMSAFDFDLAAECSASADFRILNRKYPLLAQTPVCGPLKFKLFDLPQVNLSASGPDAEQHVQLAATVADGTNNPFDKNSAEWTAPPTEAGQLLTDPANPLAAIFDCQNSGAGGSVSVVFSGDSRLGDISRRCQEIGVCTKNVSLAGNWLTILRRNIAGDGGLFDTVNVFDGFLPVCEVQVGGNFDAASYLRQLNCPAEVMDADAGLIQLQQSTDPCQKPDHPPVNLDGVGVVYDGSNVSICDAAKGVTPFEGSQLEIRGVFVSDYEFVWQELPLAQIFAGGGWCDPAFTPDCALSYRQIKLDSCGIIPFLAGGFSPTACSVVP